MASVTRRGVMGYEPGSVATPAATALATSLGPVRHPTRFESPVDRSTRRCLHAVM